MCEKIDSSESFKDFYSLDFEENVDVNISKLGGHVITFLRFVPNVLVKVSMKEMVVMQIFVLIVETKRRGTPSFLLEIIDLMLFSLWQNLHYFIRTPIRLFRQCPWCNQLCPKSNFTGVQV